MWRLKPYVTDGRWVLWALLFLALLARCWYFAFSGPPALNQDEAALLENARFLAETGADEWGMAWPFTFRSFGDAKLPGYIYTVFFLGKIIGFSALTVRLPSLVAGFVLAWLVFRLTTLLLRSREAGLAATLLLLFSPWTWHYGTLGFEAHLGVTLWVGGLWLLLQRSKTALISSSTLFFLSFITYNAPLLLLPSALGLVWLREWGHWARLVQKSGALVVAGILAASLTLSASLQKGGISVFQDPTYLNNYPAFRESISQPFLQTVLGNKVFYFGSIIWSNWWSHFSWDFLVLRGGNNPWHAIPQTGHVHYLLPILLAFGIGASIGSAILALRRGRWRRVRNELALLLLLAWSLVPAAITADAPHATRSLFFFIMASILAGRGLVAVQNAYCGSHLSRWVQHALTGVLAILLAVGAVLWWMPAGSRWQKNIHPRWNTGLNQVLGDSRVDLAEKVYVVDPHGVLYTLVLAEKNSGVSEFLSTVQRSAPDTAGLVRVERFGKFEFIFQPSDARPPGILLTPRTNRQWDIIEL